MAEIFDEDDRLKAVIPDQWRNEWVEVRREMKVRETKQAVASFDDLDEEIPF